MSATAFDRTNYKSGVPAIITWNSGSIYFKNGLTIEEGCTTFDVRTDAFAGADKRRDTLMATIKGVPSGQYINLGTWFPWLSAARGARLHGASDKTCVVKWMDGDIWTYHNAALAEMSSLILSPTKTIMDGPITLEARTKNNTAPSAANSFVTRTTGSFSDTSFSWDDIPTQVYELTWGSWEGFHTRDGVKISAKTKWEDMPCDALGVVEKELDLLEVTAEFTPVGVSMADLDSALVMQGASSAMRGSRLSGQAQNLIIEGTGVYIEMRKAALVKLPMQSGAPGKGRFGTVQMVSTLAVTDGLPVTQLLLDTEAPEE
ncbi:MAG: hypothetical protein ACO1TE_29120 [Prosthecobacter sp.]